MSPVHISGTKNLELKVPNNKGGSVNHTVYNTHSHLELRLVSWSQIIKTPSSKN
jgi:hypothetical protein